MILTIIEQVALYTPLILGAYISISLMKIPNLSIESAYICGAIFGSQLLLDGYQGIFGLLVILFASACGGALVGITSALLSEKAKFSHILSAIITIGFYHGFSQMIIGGSHITLSSNGHSPLQLLPLIKQYPEIITTSIIAVCVIALSYLFIRTKLGLSCAIYGNNSQFLKNYRINQSYVIISGLAISNALAGISGYLIAQSNGFADITMGVGLPLLCLSSLIIGKTMTLSEKPLQIATPLLGIVGYFVIQFLLLKIGFNLKYFTAIQAIILSIILILSSRQSSNQELLGI